MNKKIIAVLTVLLLTLSGCVKEPAQTDPAQTEPVPTESAQTEATFAETVPETLPEYTVAESPELPEQVVTPGEMPSAPEADAELPPQPQPTGTSK